MTRYGVLGSGVVGVTMVKGLAAHGYDVRIGTGSTEKAADLARTAGVPAGTFADVAAWAEALVLAVAGHAAHDVLTAAGAANLGGKLVMDITNPIAKDEPPEDGVIRYFTGPNDSLMERLQAAFPSAKFVKAFSSIGHELMVAPEFAGGPPTMFYCGNDADAKGAVEKIIGQFGWSPYDLGTVKAARAIEPLCQLWCIPGFREKRWRHAFKLLV